MPLSASRQLVWWMKLLHLVGQLLAFVLISVLTGFLLNLLFSTLPFMSFDSTVGELIYGWTLTLCSVLIGVKVLDHFQLRLGWPALGFTRKHWKKGLLQGLLTGGGIIVICFVILLLGGWVQIQSTNYIPGLFWTWCLFFLIQPLAEEVVMRSFLQNQVDRYFGSLAGLTVSAIVFGLLHLGNDGFTWIAGLEIILGGYLMGQLYLSTGNIWAPYAMHAIWNFLQSTVLGFAVSGMDTYRLFSLSINGPEWLTGGDFGLEGSLLSVFFIIIAIVYFWPIQNNPTPWNLAEGIPVVASLNEHSSTNESHTT